MSTQHSGLPQDEFEALEELLRHMSISKALETFQLLRADLARKVEEADRTIAELQRRIKAARKGGT
jgi:hypothetical protein